MIRRPDAKGKSRPPPRPVLSKPLVAVGGHKGVVVEVRIGPVDTVDLFPQPRTQGLLGIEQPDPLQKALAAQHLMNPGDTPGKGVDQLHVVIRGSGGLVYDTGAMTLGGSNITVHR